MFNISDYLDKFSKSINSAESDKKQIIKMIKNHIGIEFLPEKIEIKDCIVHLDCSTAVKNKIFTNKEAILDSIASLSIKIIDIK